MKSPATAKPAPQPHVAAREMADNLAELRRAIITAQDRRASVAASPLPMSEALACLDAGLAALANDATDAVLLSALVQPARRPQLVIHDHPSALRSLAIAAGQGAIREQVVRKLTSFYANKTPMSAADRDAELEKIDGELFQLGVAEESLLRDAEQLGLRVWRRPDADPRATLARLDP